MNGTVWQPDKTLNMSIRDDVYHVSPIIVKEVISNKWNWIIRLEFFFGENIYSGILVMFRVPHHCRGSSGALQHFCALPLHQAQKCESRYVTDK